MYAKSYPPRTKIRLALIERLLLGTYRLASDRGIPILFLVIPSIEQVYVEHGTVPEDFDLEKPQRVLAQFFDREDIPYLDLLPELRKARHGKDLYFWLDQHWNAQGNAVAAALLAEPIATILTRSGEASLPRVDNTDR